MLSKCWGMQTSACHGGCPLWNRIYGFALPMRLETSVARFTRWLRMCARYLSVLGLGNLWNFILNVNCYDLFHYFTTALPAWLWGDPLHSHLVSCPIPAMWLQEPGNDTTLPIWGPGVPWVISGELQPTYVGRECLWSVQERTTTANSKDCDFCHAQTFKS